MTTFGFPRPIAELCADLAGQGFDILDEQRGAAGLVLLLQGPVRLDGHWVEAFVRLVERGGDWSIAVRFDGMDNWIAVPAWTAYLDGTDPDDLDLVGQARFVRCRLSDAARAIHAAPQAERMLVRLAESGPEPG